MATSKMALSSFFGSSKKLSPNNNVTDEKRSFLESSSLQIYPAVAGQLHRLSGLPPQTDIHEWLATNSLAFFNHVNAQVGAISALCSCGSMTAGKENFEWLDDKKGSSKKLGKTPAKQFIDSSLTQIQKQLEDETIFPTKFGFEFPPDFISVVRKIFRTYFAILAHIYYHHFNSMLRLSLQEGLNTLFVHLVYFVQEFSLMEPRELQSMDELISKLVEIDKEYAKNPPVVDTDGLSVLGARCPSARTASSESKSKSNSYKDHTT